MTATIQPGQLLRRRAAGTLEDERSWSLLSMGFRPFFLLAAVFAVVDVPLWLMTLRGLLTPSQYLDPVTWHAHEMLFGYTVAVIAGFLLTAGSNWTKRNAARAPVLAALSGLWILGRLALVVPGLPPWTAALVDLAFLPALAVVLARALVRGESKRNYFFVALLSMLFVANLGYHAGAFGHADWAPWARSLALRVITVMIAVVGGRVFPMFTRNATGHDAIRNVGALDRLAMGLLLLAIALEMASVRGLVGAVAFVLAGFAHAARMATWGSRHARAPLLWVLHAGYFMLAVSLVLEGLALLGVVPFASALHALTIGTLGLTTLGMMARVSLGHSGRMLVASRSTTVAFASLAGAALVRVAAPIALPTHVAASWMLSGTLWTLAFLIFAVEFFRVWVTPRH